MNSDSINGDLIKSVINNLIKELENTSEPIHCNERYLHHFFTHQLQQITPISFGDKCIIHPEWATAKKGTNRIAKYKDMGQAYEINNDGTSGFIDLTIGSYDEPDYAIEFKMSDSVNTKGMKYDYLKLLDGRNPFKKGISILVLYGRSRNSDRLYKNVLPQCVKDAIQKIRDNNKEIKCSFSFIVLEKTKETVLIHCCNTTNGIFNNQIVII